MTFGVNGAESLPSESGRQVAPRSGVLVAGLALGIVLLAAGVVLWSQRGQAVFVDMLSSALALCF